MLLNQFETMLVNNPAREAMLRATVAWLHDAAGRPLLDRVLEIGCGNGAGVLAIDRRCRPRSIDAFDLDEAQVALARERLAELPKDGVDLRLWTGDAAHIDAEDGRYDAVFEFTIFHHVPDWSRALTEVHRVLRPGGYFLFEELSTEFFEEVPVVSALLRRFTEHSWGTMFDAAAFHRGLIEAGFTVKKLRAEVVPGWHLGVAVHD